MAEDMPNSFDDAPWYIKLTVGVSGALLAALQPWHVIALGLAIATLGVILQIRQAPPVDAKITAEQKQGAPTPKNT